MKPREAPVSTARPLVAANEGLVSPAIVMAWLKAPVRLTDRGLVTFLMKMYALGARAP